MKSKKKSKRQTPARLAVPDLASTVQRHLDEGNFREAIGGLKELLKREPSGPWRERLAVAYAARAKQLEAKGLLKEAQVMWENRAQLGEAASFDPAHTALLLRLGEIEPVIALYRGQAERLPKEVLAELRSHLAASWLGGNQAVAAAVPADDPILADGDAAKQALAAYCGGDDTVLAEALARIPFRSPYRDLVQILKALQRLPTEPREAAALLARCRVSAGFATLHRAAELALVPERELPGKLTEVGETMRRVALGLRGWDAFRQALWLELAKLGPDPSASALLRVLYRHRAELGEEWVRQRGLRLLIEDFPASLSWLAKLGAPALAPAERALVAAWHAEASGDAWDTLEAWREYASLLGGNAASAPGSELALQVALALRRPQNRSRALGRYDVGGFSDGLVKEVAALVEESLRYDPDDLASYVMLVHHYLATKRHKEARGLLEQAFGRWPEDVKLLLAALDVAIATNAFKKASGLARRILELDPINSGVRGRLVTAHVAHARKQIRAGRSDLARRELAQADEWANKAALQEQLELTAAFLDLAEDGSRGATRLREIAERFEGGLAGPFVVALEGMAVGHTPAPLLKRLGLDAARAKRPEDLHAFLARLRGHLDAGHQLPRDLAAYFEKPLKASSGVKLSFQETHSACEVLRRARLDGAREAFAKTGLKRWRGAPIFELHAFEATYRGNYRRVSDRALFRLDEAVGRALGEGDRRTAHRLRELLLEAEDAAFGPPPFPLGLNGPPNEVDALRVFVNLLGLDRLLDTMGLSPKEKAQFKQLEREVGIDKLLEALVSMSESGALTLDDLPGDSDPWPPFGPPAQPKPSTGRGKAPGKKKPGKASAAETAPPNQLDLFE